MNNDIKEKLIDLVRENECLYNIKNKNYKNISYKSLLWEKIGATLHIQGSKAKDTWRTLRDGYIRHKKIVKGQTGASKKYSNFTWSSQMSFLDGTLELRPTSTNITQSQPDSDPPQSPSPVPRESSPVPRQSSPIPREQREPGPSWMYPDPEIDDSSLSISDTPYFPSSTQSQQLPTTRSQPMQSPGSRTTKKNDGRSIVDNSERVLDYLRQKKKKEWDGVDHLFMSYAKSFKQLSVRNQSKIKVEIAKLFADAELDDFENLNSTHEHQNQSPSLVYLSPAYSVISEESTEVISEDRIEQTMPPGLLAEHTEPTQEVLLAIDLTNYNYNSNESQN